MRDVLELRQIKLELAAYMGEEYPPTPVIPDTSKEAQEVESTSLVEEAEAEGEASMPTTPLLDASPLLEQSELPAPLPLQGTELSTSPVKASNMSSASPASLSLGPGMEIDLSSLIVAPFLFEEQEAKDMSQEEASSMSTAPASTEEASATLPSITPSSSSSSSEPALSASTSLSCSPTTSDSESFGNLSAEEEYDDSSSSSRRGSDDTSCDDDDEVEYDINMNNGDLCEHGDSGVEVYERDADLMMMGDVDNSRTPTRISSLLRTPPHANHHNVKHDNFQSQLSSTMKKNGTKDQFDVGCITIALPALGSDGFSTSPGQATFDLSSTTNHCDPWNPSTF